MLSLGMPAHAAAAHGFTSRPSIAHPPSLSLPRQRVAFVAVPEAASTPALQPAAAPPSPTRRLSAMIAESSLHPSSDEEHSRTGSFQSTSTTPRGSVRKTLFKPKTSFQIAHPPPIIKPKQRLKLRPRVLLQLHHLSDTSRPTPALDVLPSTIFAPKLRTRFPRLFKGRDGLGPNDLVVATSDSYAISPSTDDDKSSVSDDEGWDHRDVVATICQLRKGDGGGRGKAEIFFEHGSWSATPLMNGGYEFVTTDEHGVQTKARWVLRNKPHRRTSSVNPGSTSRVDEDKRFTFSLIDPSTRRHPVIASLNRSNIEVVDQYPSTLPSPETPLSPASVMSSSTNYFDTPAGSNLPMNKTDDRLRTLIIITGIWVVFREGWSKSFSYVDAMSQPLSPIISNSYAPRRSATVDRERDLSAPSSDQDGPLARKPRRSGTNFLHRSSASAHDPLNLKGHETPPKRTNSSGAAFMEKASNRRSLSTARRVRQLASTASSEDSSEERPRARQRFSLPPRIDRDIQTQEPVLEREKEGELRIATINGASANGHTVNPAKVPVESSIAPSPQTTEQKGPARWKRLRRLWNHLKPHSATAR